MVKILYNNIVVLLAIFIKITSQVCNEYPQTQMIEKNIPVLDEDNQLSYDGDDDYDSPSEYRRPFITETITINSTIICSNLFSLEQITYDYQERDYPQLLKIVYSNISTIPSLGLSKFTTITKLYMNYLNVHEIIPGAFNGLTRLKELYLDNNELTELSKGVYNSLHRLEILHLANNKIQKIEEYSLSGLADLKELYLKNNQILKIENGLFETQKHLKYLDLSGNPLEEFSDESLASLDNLILTKTSLHEFDLDLSHATMNVLNLSSSQLSTVNFVNFPKAESLDLSRNQITEVENCDSLDLSFYIDLRNNQLMTINGTFIVLSELYLGHNNFMVLNKSIFARFLSILDFSFNNICEIEKDTFNDFFLLRKLFLQGNKLVRIDQSLFKKVPNLNYLNLSNNKIKEFQFGTFDNLNNLIVLDISNNHLIDLHQYTFNSLFKLTHLYFDNNQISSIHVNDLWDHLRALKFISLNNNPWNCKDLVQISHYLKKVHVIIAEGDNYDTENYHGIACSHQKEFTNALNVSIKDLAKDISESINGGLKNSKMNNFFNEDFQKSKFFQYFDNDYIKSNFFKYLGNYKFITVNQPVLNDSNTEKLTSLQVTPNENNNKIFIFIGIFLLIITFVLLCQMLLMFNFFKKANCNRKPEPTTLSQIELC